MPILFTIQKKSAQVLKINMGKNTVDWHVWIIKDEKAIICKLQIVSSFKILVFIEVIICK